ncbi:hypothetical protein JKG47_04730 [Acidithiobacillus sp. MC6.1]|nr:hypothetical protein [Acidithiobacillus sp. MC6.1]
MSDNKTTMQINIASMDGIAVEDALKIVERLEQVAIIGAPSIIPNRDMADFVTQKLARSIAYHPGARNKAYIQELVNTGFTKRNSQKIVWNARKLATTIEVPPMVQSAPAPASVQTHISVPIQAPAGGVVTIGKGEVKASASGLKRGIDSLCSKYPEIFAGYERYEFRRPMTPDSPRGTYSETNEETLKYGKIWGAVGFRLVPEHLPILIDRLESEGLLDLYNVQPKLVAEIRETRDKMIAAGVPLELPRSQIRSDASP